MNTTAGIADNRFPAVKCFSKSQENSRIRHVFEERLDMQRVGNMVFRWSLAGLFLIAFNLFETRAEK
jgi:hypothetical protein